MNANKTETSRHQVLDRNNKDRRVKVRKNTKANARAKVPKGNKVAAHANSRTKIRPSRIASGKWVQLMVRHATNCL